MKLNRKFRMAAGTAAITFAAALAMPGIASAGNSHDGGWGDDHAASAEHRGDVSDHHGDDADHRGDAADHRGEAADHRGDAPCPKKEEAKPAPAAKPVAKTTYPTQSKTGSVAVPGSSSESGIVLVTLAAATALGGVAVRRATSR